MNDDEWAHAPDLALTKRRLLAWPLSLSFERDGFKMLHVMSTDIAYLPEQPVHNSEIEEINAEAFGPGRFTRAAYAIREGGPHEHALSFVATNHEGAVIASVRLTRVAAGEGRALLLGPLAVRPAYKNQGIGRKLVDIALEAARASGAGLVVLVGDEPYYGPLGFKHIPKGQITMPRPVDQNRLLAVELKPAALEAFKGEVVHEERVRE